MTYEPDAARREASRCLECDRFCSLCVGVCPNLALQTYEVDSSSTLAGQRYQVAVIADLCNECGNCTTFCPTSGRPFRDKPRLYVDRDEFDAQRDNAFMIFKDGKRWSMDARHGGETYHIDSDAEPSVSEPYATMQQLLSGIAASAPDLPIAARGSDG